MVDFVSSILVSCQTCSVLEHIWSVTGHRRSYLSFLVLTGCLMLGWCLQSADVPLVYRACGRLVFVDLSWCTSLWSAQIYDSSCTGIFLQGMSNLLHGWNCQVCCICPFACEHFWDQRTSCGSLIAFGLHFVLHSSCLGLGLWLLIFAIWQLCVLVSHQVDLGSLCFTCNLLDMPSGGLGSLIFLCKLVQFASWKLVQVHTAFIYGLGNKFFLVQKEPKYVPMQDLCSLRWIFC